MRCQFLSSSWSVPQLSLIWYFFSFVRISCTHLWGIINAIILKVSNGPAEGLNSRIKTAKVRSRGFRNKQRFANAIYFHLGGLKLYPEGAR